MGSSSEKPSSSALKLFGFPLSTAIICSEEAPQKIECPYCDRKFQNFQALEGHQNAHRRERLMARLSRLHYIHPHQNNSQLLLHTEQPTVLLSQTSAADADHEAQIWRELPKLPVAEPPGTGHPPIRQVPRPVPGVDNDSNLDLELRLATSSFEESRR
ncbi:Zinc finger C2H2-type [Sesbania bispinosa]|nr:Zinc finger C2H2-type [Sesbania bispinosa]